MSQHDLDIANQGFPATRADLNLALKALGSSNSGATAPSTTYANQLWYDTANNILKIRNEDNDAWISLFTLDQTNDNIEALTINGTLTATGAFTSPGIDDNADATAITIDSSENVMIGTTDTVPSNNGASGDAGVAISPDGVFRAARSGNVLLDINRMDSDGEIAAFRKDGTTVGLIGSKGGDLTIGTGAIGVRFEDSNSAIVPFDTGTLGGSDNDIDLGKSSVRWNDLYLGGNLYLGGTGSVNALDDYEEGNFAVTVSSGISISSYDHQLGHYVKVGRQVTAWVFMEYNGSSRTGAHFIISGLPFNTSDDNTTESTFGGFITYQNGFSNTNNIVHVPRGTNIIQFYEVDGSTLIGSELSGASGEIRVVVQYTVP